MPHRDRAWIIPTALFADLPALRHMLEQVVTELQHEARDEGLVLDRATVRRRLDLPLPDTDVPAPAGDVLAAYGVTVTRPEYALEHAIATTALLTTGADLVPDPLTGTLAGDPSSSGGHGEHAPAE